MTCFLHWFQVSQPWLGSAAQWISGLATTAAVLVALFRDPYIRWRNRPILKASIAPRPPDCAKNVAWLQDQRTGVVGARADCYYLRLWVENWKGRAEQVQVYAAALFKQDAGGEFQRVGASCR